MQLIARISELERQHMALLARLPPDFQQKFHARHKEAAAEPGKKPRGRARCSTQPSMEAKALRPQHSRVQWRKLGISYVSEFGSYNELRACRR